MGSQGMSSVGQSGKLSAGSALIDITPPAGTHLGGKCGILRRTETVDIEDACCKNEKFELVIDRPAPEEKGTNT